MPAITSEIMTRMYMFRFSSMLSEETPRAFKTVSFCWILSILSWFIGRTLFAISLAGITLRSRSEFRRAINWITLAGN